MSKLDKINELVQSAVALQRGSNDVNQNDTISLLSSQKDRDSQEKEMRAGVKQSQEILKSLCKMIDFVDPSVKASSKVSAALLKDLSSSNTTSANYEPLIEQVCDDLLESADKTIDQLKFKKDAVKVVPVDHPQNLSNRMRTENTMRKPQHAWIRDIDNSYNNFVPCFTKKVHFIESADLPKEFQEAQARKEANP